MYMSIMMQNNNADLYVIYHILHNIIVLLTTIYFVNAPHHWSDSTGHLVNHTVPVLYCKLSPAQKMTPVDFPIF